ncbi:hypothetical protein ASPZODRAFT_1087476 [Penicilliopsis zonata CBS 506.65]|uniref:Uncharacterized protein n=1 Tax=Penicilliopsis zonata CBS 506.65 TaxID=1073090 RepID=A0A1L9SS22_9EURO|nr:hypothetical protein ASPZODRAFT_1087476 [Penicilliopsis zonata CBS 506.65]OJJ50005.1 hypothetical protein ASPZODRAFT_1087476 [Penicilliopsis zonata CBS 506.65]
MYPSTQISEGTATALIRQGVSSILIVLIACHAGVVVGIRSGPGIAEIIDPAAPLADARHSLSRPRHPQRNPLALILPAKMRARNHGLWHAAFRALLVIEKLPALIPKLGLAANPDHPPASCFLQILPPTHTLHPSYNSLFCRPLIASPSRFYPPNDLFHHQVVLIPSNNHLHNGPY